MLSRVLRVLGVVALVVLGGCFWPVPGQNPDRTAYNPFETTLGPANVGQLTLRWTWSAGTGTSVRVHGPVTSTAGVHVVTSDCRLTTLDRTSGRVAWDAVVGFYPDFGDGCGITTVGDPFVANNRVWVGRQAFFWRNPPSPATFENTSTLGFTLDGSSVEQWSGGLLDNLRGQLAHGISGHIVSTPLPPPFPPLPQFSFVTTVSIGELGQEWHVVNVPAEPAGVTIPGRTLGETALYDAGNGTLATVPGDTSSGNGVRAFALEGAQTGCGPSTSTHDCPIWATPLDGTSVWRPIIDNDGTTLYVGTDAGTVYAIDTATGAIQWSAVVGSAVTNSLALADDTLFVPTASGDLVALAAHGCGTASCAPAWSGAAGGRIDQQPAVANGVVYTASANGSLRAFAADGCGDATCAALWSNATGRKLSAGPVISAGWLYVAFDGDPAAQATAGVLAYTLP